MSLIAMVAIVIIGALGIVCQSIGFVHPAFFWTLGSITGMAAMFVICEFR